MKLLFYKSLLLFFAFTGIVWGQKHTVLKKSFNIGSTKVLELDLKNVPITIEESNDNMIHADFIIDSKKYDKSKINNILKGINFTSKKENQTFKINFNSKNKIYEREYYSGYNHELSKKNIDSILKNITDSLGHTFFIRKKSKSKFLRHLDQRLKSRGIRFVYKEGFKGRGVGYETFFILKIPKRLKIKIISNYADIDLKIEKVFNLTSEKFNKSFLQVRTLIGAKMNSKESDFWIKEIINSDFKFNDAKRIKIGQIKNSTIESELSKIEIGEIQQGVTIKDFNSSYYFQNYSDNFNNLIFNGEYSKVCLFGKEENYSLDIFGNNTAIELANGMKTTFGIKKNNEIDKLLSKKKKRFSDDYKGHIKMTITNGFIYLKK